MNGKGYAGAGYDGDNYMKDFYEFDATANSWTRKTDLAGSARIGATGFSVNGKGYIGIGYDGSYKKDYFEFWP